MLCQNQKRLQEHCSKRLSNSDCNKQTFRIFLPVSKWYGIGSFVIFLLAHFCLKTFFSSLFMKLPTKVGLWCQKNRFKFSGLHLVQLPRFRNFVKFLPIDKNSMDMLSPIIDFTSKNENDDECFMESLNGIDSSKMGAGFCNERRITSSELRRKKIEF